MIYRIVSKILLVGCLFGVWGMLMACGAETVPPVPTETSRSVVTYEYDTTTLQEGQIGYQAFCTACHAPDAKGLTGLGANLVDGDFITTRTDEDVLAFIIAGRAADHPENVSGVAMPARGGYPNLSDDDLLAIIAYLRDLALNDI